MGKWLGGNLAHPAPGLRTTLLRRFGAERRSIRASLVWVVLLSLTH